MSTVESVPLVSVITATRNAVAGLPFTIASLRAQTCPAFEWLVADAGSNDGTVDLLRKNQDLISWWVSEPDAGIYDAWNKACRHARGEWLLFLGAADELAQPETLERCARYLVEEGGGRVLVYGRLELLSQENRVPLEVFGMPWEEVQGKWEIGRPALPPHGACFHHRSLFADPTSFDLRFPIAADAHFLLRILGRRPGVPPLFMPLVVTRSPIGGVSFRLDTARQVSREIAAINHDLGLSAPLTVRAFDTIRLFVISILNCLPVHFSHRVADLLRGVTGKPGRWSAR